MQAGVAIMQTKEENMRKIPAKFVLVLVLAVSVATLAGAGELVKYGGMVKGFDEEKSEVIIFPDNAREKGLPRRMGIRLVEKDFKRASNAFIKNNNSNPPKGTKVIADCDITDGVPFSVNLVIIPIGC